MGARAPMQDAKMIIYDRTRTEAPLSGPLRPMGKGLHVHLDGRLRGKGGLYWEHEKALEHIAEAYREGSLKDKVPTWNAMFTAAVWDESKETFTWITDRLAYHQHFFARTASGFMISDRFKEVLAAVPSASIDHTAALEFLRYRYLTGEETLCKEITSLPPAAITTIDLKEPELRLSSEVHFRFHHRPEERSLQEDALAYTETLTQVLREECESLAKGKSIQLTLTGGADSRFLFAILKGKLGRLDRTITFGAEGSEDLLIARSIASAFQLPHTEVDLDKDIACFFDVEEMDHILSGIGHSTFHYQGYAMERMLSRADRQSALMTGVDGFWLGLNAKPHHFDGSLLSSDLPGFLLKEQGAFLSASLTERLTGLSEKEQEKILLAHLEPQIQKGGDVYSAYMDWLFKNKARRYISADYGLSSRKVALHYPFDDHRLIDLALRMPAEHLLKQNVYMSAMMEHAFVGGMRELANMPFEMAELKAYGDGSYQLVSAPRPFLNRILNKVKARPDHRQSYPIADYIYEHWASFERQFETLLEASPSQLIDHAELRTLVKEMRTKDMYFFHKPLSSILSLMRMEQWLKS